MIVICTGCQAKFRVADDKVGPRGAKVRCSRCQTVFLVRRDAAAATPPPPEPRLEIDLTPGLGGISPGKAWPGPAPGGAAVIPFPGPASQRSPAPDPFAAAGLDAFGEPGASAADDPFAHMMGAPPAGGRPSLEPGAAAGRIAMGGGGLPPDDPFAQAAAAPGPFGELSSGSTGSQSLPVTDLSQLLGASPPAPPPPAAAPSVFPDSFEPQLRTEPEAPEEPQLGLDGPGSEPPPGPPGFPTDLALEEHSAEHQAPFADPADVVTSGEGAPMAFSAAAFESGPMGPLFGAEESLALATDPTPGPAEERPPAPAPAPDPLGEPAPAVRRVAPAPALEEDDRVQAGLAQPGALAVPRLRTAAVNALALVALLAIALGFRVVLRGEASMGPSALRPSTLLRALRRAPLQSGAFEVAGVRSGVYPQTSGGTVLFVRGEVVSRAPAPVGGVRVEAELIRDGQVLARGEVRAGAVPTPEELDRAGDRAALDELTAAVRKRSPRVVAPGDRLAFLVTLGDAPADVSGTSIRVHAEAEGAGK